MGFCFPGWERGCGEVRGGLTRRQRGEMKAPVIVILKASAGDGGNAPRLAA